MLPPNKGFTSSPFIETKMIPNQNDSKSKRFCAKVKTKTKTIQFIESFFLVINFVKVCTDSDCHLTEVETFFRYLKFFFGHRVSLHALSFSFDKL